MNSNTTKSNNTKPRFGDIQMVCLDYGRSSVQSGYRPAMIVSNDMNNEYSPTVNIIPITSKSKKNLPIHVSIDGNEENGLATRSTLLIEQMTTISVSALSKRIGRISDGDTLRKIASAMQIQFPCFARNK